jgi:hypothetical protein
LFGAEAALEDPVVALIPILQLEERARRLPPTAVFSGHTAGWLHGLDVPPCDPMEVTLPRLARTSRLAGVTLMRSDIAVAEITRIRDLPATSGTRTVADLARRAPCIDAVILIEIAVRRRITDLDALIGWAKTHRGYRGVSRLGFALKLAAPRSESPMETRLRLLLVSNGLPRPLAQPVLTDGTGMFIARPDLFYPGAGLVIEYDGVVHRHNLQADNKRQNRLIDAGYRVLRFTASDVLGTPAGVVSLVRRNLLDRFSELPAARFR